MRARNEAVLGIALERMFLSDGYSASKEQGCDSARLSVVRQTFRLVVTRLAGCKIHQPRNISKPKILMYVRNTIEWEWTRFLMSRESSRYYLANPKGFWIVPRHDK